MDFCPEVLLQKLQQDVLLISHSDDLKQYKARVLQSTILKKFVSGGANRALHDAATDSFIRRNEGLGDKFDVPNHRMGLFRAWQNRIFDTTMTDPYQTSVLSLNSCFLLGKPGPGATRGTRHTDFYRKMWTSNLTYTNEILASHYEASLPDRWVQASNLRRQNFSDRQVLGSSLTSVPKDSKKNRCICTEPALNMFYQLGAHSVFSQILLRHFRLDIRLQSELNKKAAQQGSIDGSNATIDLSDASDHIHYDLIKQLLPQSVFRCLDVIRSPGFEYEGKYYDFKMISSMGNGFTFAFMTYLIVTLLDVFLEAAGERYTPGRDGVFGDDIILPSHLATEFTAVLSDFGFKVNLDKSFITGFFRESCGGDFYHGHNVRGVYIKELTHESQSYSAFNRLLIWSIRNAIHLHHTLLYVKGLAKFRPVPLHEAEDAGIRIPYEFVTARKTDRNGSVYYRPLVAKRNSFRVGDQSLNHFGAYIAALGGFVRGHKVSYRNKPGAYNYQVARRLTPNWNYTPHAELKTQEVSWFWLTFVVDQG